MNKGIRASLCGGLLGMALAVGGCADGLDGGAASSHEPTKYKRFTRMTGGAYTEVELGGGVFKVLANTNDVSSREMARKIVTVRSAEITKERGYKYFVVTGARSLVGCSMNGGQFLYGGPLEEWTIKVLKEPEGYPADKLFEAEAVIAELMPQVLEPQVTHEEKLANRTHNRVACQSGRGQGLPESEMPYLGR